MKGLNFTMRKVKFLILMVLSHIHFTIDFIDKFLA